MDFTNDVTFQASYDLTFTVSVFRVFLDVGKCRFVAPHSDDGHTPECSVGLSIAASVQAEAMCFAAGRRNWADAAKFCKGSLRADARWIVPNEDQHLSDCQCRYSMGRHQVWCAFGDKAFQFLFVCNNLLMKPYRP